MTREAVDRFYAAFAAVDAEAMIAEYTSDVVFQDPVFGTLRGSDAGDMWRMLCANATDLEVEHTIDDASETDARVRWIARYTFSTGRPVTNHVTAAIRFRDGKISQHEDSFSLWRWTSQAFGPTGRVLGWSPMVQNKVRSTARRGLETFQAKTD